MKVFVGFTFWEPRNPSLGDSELHKVCLSLDFEALELMKMSDGPSFIYTNSITHRLSGNRGFFMPVEYALHARPSLLQL